MVHKAFEVVGERVLLDVSLEEIGRVKKLGIFQESDKYETTVEGAPRPALDFIEPIYKPNSAQEMFAKGLIPRERRHSQNPILSFHLGIDHLKLNYKGEREGIHIFEGGLDYVAGLFYNDGNFEVFDRYREPLKKAGFKIFS